MVRIGFRSCPFFCLLIPSSLPSPPLFPPEVFPENCMTWYVNRRNWRWKNLKCSRKDGTGRESLRHTTGSSSRLHRSTNFPQYNAADTWGCAKYNLIESRGFLPLYCANCVWREPLLLLYAYTTYQWGTPCLLWCWLKPSASASCSTNLHRKRLHNVRWRPWEESGSTEIV